MTMEKLRAYPDVAAAELRVRERKAGLAAAQTLLELAEDYRSNATLRALSQDFSLTQQSGDILRAADAVRDAIQKGRLQTSESFSILDLCSWLRGLPESYTQQFCEWKGELYCRRDLENDRLESTGVLLEDLPDDDLIATPKPGETVRIPRPQEPGEFLELPCHLRSSGLPFERIAAIPELVFEGVVPANYCTAEPGPGFVLVRVLKRGPGDSVLLYFPDGTVVLSSNASMRRLFPSAGSGGPGC